MERSEELALTALRRSFLIDMAWPVSSDVLCDMFGLPKASDEVTSAEMLESWERMAKFTGDERAVALLHSAAQDFVDVLGVLEDREDKIAWAATYALAVMNLLETAGCIEVKAA